MPRTLTESATFDVPGGETVPSDGDPENAASVAATSVGFQALANRTQFLKSALNGFALGGFDVACTDGVNLKITPYAALVLGASLGSNTGVQSYAPTTANNAWGYVYAAITAGALGYETSATPPDATRTFKAGDTTRRYVCAFHTGATPSPNTTIRQFTYSRGVYQYRFSQMTANSASEVAAFVAVNSSAAASSLTNINLDDFVPPGAQFVDLLASFSQGNGAAAGFLNLQPSGDAQSWMPFQGAPSSADYRYVPVTLAVGTYAGPHRGIAYTYTPGVAPVTLGLTITGFRE